MAASIRRWRITAVRSACGPRTDFGGHGALAGFAAVMGDVCERSRGPAIAFAVSPDLRRRSPCETTDFTDLQGFPGARTPADVSGAIREIRGSVFCGFAATTPAEVRSS